MKVNWKTYADNIGHKNWPGCFRCHDDRHVSKSGKVLSRDCQLCHTEPVRGLLQPMGMVEAESNSGLPWHPMELLGKHDELLCSDCHSAGFRPPADCAECHGLDKNAPMMSSGCNFCHDKSQKIKPVEACIDCHSESQKGLHIVDEHSESSCIDCHKPHTWLVKGRSTCLQCHDDKQDHKSERVDCKQCHSFRG